MLWVLKRTVSMRRFFEHPKQMFKLSDQKLLTILRPNICLFGGLTLFVILTLNFTHIILTYTGHVSI